MGKNMDSRLVVVSGGGQGIGLAITKRLASDGSRVAILDLNAERAANTAAELPAGQGFGFACDVTDAEQVTDVAKRITADLGVPEVVVLNQGGSPEKTFLQMSIDEQNFVINLNFVAGLNVTRAFLPDMVDTRGGRLVFISSDAARVGVPGQAVYAGAKAAVIGFAKSMAVELARYAITVNVVCPGSTETPAMHEMLTDDGIAKRIKLHPMRRFAEPDDIATAVQYFASRDASFVTGQVISVNGGMLRVG
jgi:2-hydroxycyclohexanecarboxyl-CoA dehydrogenase